MITQFGWKVLTLGLLAGFIPATSFAQFGGFGREARPGMVTGVGTVSMRPEPAELRMTVQLTEKAGTLKEALAKLKTRSDAAAAQMVQFGAAKNDVKVADPSIAELSRQQQQMARMVRMQRNRGGRPTPPATTPKTVSVTSAMTVSWKLSGNSRSALLQLCDDIKTKVAKADLAGINEAKKLTPEEEELAEEQSINQFDEGETPGEPRFFFVGHISDEVRQKALKEAFDKAKASAQQLASAAGIALGELSSVSGSATTDNEGQLRQYYRMMGEQSGPMSEHDNEVVAPTPDALQSAVHVEALFAIKK